MINKKNGKQEENSIRDRFIVEDFAFINLIRNYEMEVVNLVTEVTTYV